jgi:exocyst complex component 2
MRDYKKGKVLLESRPGQLLPGAAPAQGQQSSVEAELQQKRIVDKVWGTVEKVMGDMKSTLLAKLKEHSRSVEDPEKTIE